MASFQNVMRPPSRHKDPPQNIGLDLPVEEGAYLDNDSDSSFGFENGIDNAPNNQLPNADSDSFERHDSSKEDATPNNEFLNQSGNKKAIAAAFSKVRAQKRSLI